MKRNRFATFALSSAIALLTALCAAAPASATCSVIIDDFTPGLHGISCAFESGSEETWTVPPLSTEPTFTLRGADDEFGNRGGYLEAKSPVIAGDEFHLTLGSEGAASSVSSNGNVLLIAEGGSGAQPNYVSPEAQLLASEEPGSPVNGGARNGAIVIEWYDRRPFFNLTTPLPGVSIDVFGDEIAELSYTGGKQGWTVPEGVNRAAFELFGGAGESGEPRGHVLAGLKVSPGEGFVVEVGGPGEDTTAHRGDTVLRAAGGDTERDNYLPFGASPAEEFWEGGGPGSESGDGLALVHYWFAGSIDEEPAHQDSEVPGQVQLAPHPSDGVPNGSSAPCVVPRLRGKRPRAARRALRQANCTLDKGVRRRHASRRMRGRVVRQSPRPGSLGPPAARVSVVLGVG